MRRKTRNKGLMKYTVFVPKTINATKNASSNIIKKINSFLKNTTRKLKNISESLDKRTAKSIRSLTKRRM